MPAIMVKIIFITSMEIKLYTKHFHLAAYAAITEIKRVFFTYPIFKNKIIF
jgi:hypothetical protein